MTFLIQMSLNVFLFVSSVLQTGLNLDIKCKQFFNYYLEIF